MFPWLERFKEKVAKRRTVMHVSKCHKEPVEVVGNCTQYYVCSKCGLPCDAMLYSQYQYEKDHKDVNDEQSK